MALSVARPASSAHGRYLPPRIAADHSFATAVFEARACAHADVLAIEKPPPNRRRRLLTSGELVDVLEQNPFLVTFDEQRLRTGYGRITHDRRRRRTGVFVSMVLHAGAAPCRRLRSPRQALAGLPFYDRLSRS